MTEVGKQSKLLRYAEIRKVELRMFKPEQIEGSVWVLGYEEGEKYFFCRKLFEHGGSQYAIMFSMFDCEVDALEKEEEGHTCDDSCTCHDDEELRECEECDVNEEECEERDIAVLKVVTGVDGEPDVMDLTEEEDKQLEKVIDDLLEEIDEEDEEESDEE